MEEEMGVHIEPRCKKCRYSQGGKGNDFLCGLLRTRDGEPALVVTLTTSFERFENCAYRRWDQMIILNELNSEDLVDLARRARAGEITLTDYPWEREVA